MCELVDECDCLCNDDDDDDRNELKHAESDSKLEKIAPGKKTEIRPIKSETSLLDISKHFLVNTKDLVQLVFFFRLF